MATYYLPIEDEIYYLKQRLIILQKRCSKYMIDALKSDIKTTFEDDDEDYIALDQEIKNQDQEQNFDVYSNNYFDNDFVAHIDAHLDKYQDGSGEIIILKSNAGVLIDECLAFVVRHPYDYKYRRSIIKGILIACTELIYILNTRMLKKKYKKYMEE